MKSVQLRKNEVRSMVQSRSDGKPHLVQIYDLKASESGGKPRMSMRVSDGCHFIRAVAGMIPDLKDYDVINVTGYKITEVKGNIVMIIEKAERAFTNISGLIGSPVEHKLENPGAGGINLAIPSTAKPVVGLKASPAPGPSPSAVKGAPQTKAAPKPSASRPSVGEVKGVKPIKALGLYSTDWTIKVRLLRKGDTKKFTKEKTGESFLVPLEFIDEEGTQISATLFGEGVTKYQAILEPMKCYLISGGSVRLANKKYTSIKTDYSLNLDAASKIEEVPDDPVVPRTGYCFTPISKIAELPNMTVIDVIGVIKSVGEPAQFPRRDGTQTTKRVVTLCDDSGHAIEVTLWGAHAETELKEEEIVAFRCVKVSEYSGKQLNTMGETMVSKDPDDPRAEKLREWQQNSAGAEIVSLTTKGSFSGGISLIAELVKTGETLPVDPKGMVCMISGNIIAIQYEKGYFYSGCKKCKKKCLDKSCDRCKEENAAVPYYMFNMKVSDGTDSVWVHVFGDQGEIILGKSAAEVTNLQETDPVAFKQTFEKPKGNVSFGFFPRGASKMGNNKTSNRHMEWW